MSKLVEWASRNVLKDYAECGSSKREELCKQS